MDATNPYITVNKDKFLCELLELLRIPSISADPAYTKDVAKAADFLASHLTEIGLDNVKIYPTEGHPIVYGEKIINPDFPTVLVYGHYDVQPADPIELW